MDNPTENTYIPAIICGWTQETWYTWHDYSLPFSINALYSSSYRGNILAYHSFASTWPIFFWLDNTTSIHLYTAAVAHIAVMSRQVNTFKSRWLLWHVWVIIRISRIERRRASKYFLWGCRHSHPSPVHDATNCNISKFSDLVQESEVITACLRGVSCFGLLTLYENTKIGNLNNITIADMIK